MSYIQAFLLGIVQGITEFFPVSSSGHLVILENLFEMKIQPSVFFSCDFTRRNAGGDYTGI